MKQALFLIAFLGVVVGALIVAPPASADAIRMPAECPPGWHSRRVGHGGYCVPTSCQGPADCGGRACVEVARCYRQSPVPSGRRPRDDTWSRPLEATCEGDTACSSGECRTRRECAAPPVQAAAEPSATEAAPTEPPASEAAPTEAQTASPASEPDDGSCSVDGSAPQAGSWLVLTGALLLTRRKR